MRRLGSTGSLPFGWTVLSPRDTPFHRTDSLIPFDQVWGIYAVEQVTFVMWRRCVETGRPGRNGHLRD